jgi:hypothetical protein
MIMHEVEREGIAVLAEQAERLLHDSPYLALRMVSCESRKGVLVLRGSLPTYYLKQLAQATVARGLNAPTVVNEIEVTGSGRHSW